MCCDNHCRGTEAKKLYGIQVLVGVFYPMIATIAFPRNIKLNCSQAILELKLQMALLLQTRENVI